jgi:hypothetical protein
MTPILNQKLQVGRPYEIKFVNPKNFKKITLKEVTLKKNARGNYGLDFNGQKISRKMHSKITIYDKGSQPTLRVDLE